MALSPETLEAINALGDRIVAGLMQAGSRASVGGAPQMAALLTVREPLTGEAVPVDKDPEGGGIGLTVKGTAVVSLSTSPLPLREDGGIRKLAQQLLDTSSTLIFTADQDYTDVFILVSNVDGTSDRTFQLSHGSSLADSTMISNKNQNLTYTDPPSYFEGVGLKTGEKLYGLCSSASKVNVSVYGVPVATGA